jgi:SsrA-binding protein
MKKQNLTFQNKKATHEYHILERKEVGVMLLGWEIKAIRAGKLSLNKGWVRYMDDGWKWWSEITPLKEASTHAIATPWRERTLLLKKRESSNWAARVQERGLTIVPRSGSFSGRWFKLEIALVRGKKEYDKRETLKKADVEKEILQTVKRNKLLS